MIRCPRCQKHLPDQTRLCTYCGCPIEAQAPVFQPVKKSKLSKPLLIILLAALMVLATIGVGWIFAPDLLEDMRISGRPSGKEESSQHDDSDEHESKPVDFGEQEAKPGDSEAAGQPENGDFWEMESTISLWVYPIGRWADSASVEELITAFNQEFPNIHVNVKYLTYTNGDDQVNTAIEAGCAPDIVLEGPERLVTNWGAKGVVVDLSDLWTADVRADTQGAVVSACRGSDGGMYEYPLCMMVHCMAINRDVFEEAGAMQYIDEETRTWTTEGFLAAVDAVYKYTGTTVGKIYCGGQGGDQGTRALVTNLYSGSFTNAGHTAYTVNSPENVEALNTLANQPGLEFDPVIVGGDEIQAFYNGELNMAFCWNIAQHMNPGNAGTGAGRTADGDEIMFMAFPSDDGVPELCGGVWGFGVFDNGDDIRILASKTFIKWVCDEYTEEAVEMTGFCSTRKSYTGLFADDPIRNEFSVLLPYFGDYYQVASHWSDARIQWWKMLQSIHNGTAPQTAADQFVKKMNELG